MYVLVCVTCHKRCVTRKRCSENVKHFFLFFFFLALLYIPHLEETKFKNSLFLTFSIQLSRHRVLSGGTKRCVLFDLNGDMGIIHRSRERIEYSTTAIFTGKRCYAEIKE